MPVIFLHQQSMRKQLSTQTHVALLPPTHGAGETGQSAARRLMTALSLVPICYRLAVSRLPSQRHHRHQHAVKSLNPMRSKMVPDFSLFPHFETTIMFCRSSWQKENLQSSKLTNTEYSLYHPLLEQLTINIRQQNCL